MIKNTCPNAGTPSAILAGAAGMGAGLAAATGVLRPTDSASTGRNTIATLVRTEITPLRAMKGQSQAVTAQPAPGAVSLTLPRPSRGRTGQWAAAGRDHARSPQNRFFGAL